jgi:hypothetical protein
LQLQAKNDSSGRLYAAAAGSGLVEATTTDDQHQMIMQHERELTTIGLSNLP